MEPLGVNNVFLCTLLVFTTFSCNTNEKPLIKRQDQFHKEQEKLANFEFKTSYYVQVAKKISIYYVGSAGFGMTLYNLQELKKLKFIGHVRHTDPPIGIDGLKYLYSYDFKATKRGIEKVKYDFFLSGDTILKTNNDKFIYVHIY